MKFGDISPNTYNYMTTQICERTGMAVTEVETEAVVAEEVRASLEPQRSSETAAAQQIKIFRT